MTKTGSLIVANLKSFMRNRTSMLLLVVSPLLLVLLVFSSLNAENYQKISIGLVSYGSYEEMEEFRAKTSDYLRITDFSNLADCTEDLKRYNQYLCVEVINGKPIILDIRYDNTREPVIFQILQRIKSAVDIIQKERSREIASDFLVRFNNAMGKLADYKINLARIDSNIASYLDEIDSSINELQDAKSDLSVAISNMDNDIHTIKTTKNNLKNQKDGFYSTASFYIGYIKGAAGLINVSYPTTDYFRVNNIISYANSLNNTLQSFNSASDGYFNALDSRIAAYEEASRKGKESMAMIDRNIEKLKNTRQDLILYRQDVGRANRDIRDIENDFKAVQEVDADLLVNPIVIKNTPTYNSLDYNPHSSSTQGQQSVEEILRGFNTISMQTLFPKLLFLITLFLSLLISNFIAVTHINAPAIQRIRLIKGISVQELVSIYASSLIIMALPIGCVLLLGNYVFNVSILHNIGFVAIILLLMSSNFILVGIWLAYLIKKESIAMLVTTFALVFLVFFSGILVPLESMGSTFRTIVSNFPSNIAMEAFSKAVFYEQGWNILSNDILLLSLWFFVSLAIALVIKKAKNA